MTPEERALAESLRRLVVVAWRGATWIDRGLFLLAVGTWVLLVAVLALH